MAEGLLTEQAPAPVEQAPEGQVSREQMDKLEGAIATGMNIIANDEVLQSIVAEAQKSPVDALANTTVAVIQKVGETDPTIALGVGVVLIGTIADALQKLGLPEFSPQQLQDALQAAVFLWLKENEGNLDPAQMQQHMAELQQLAGGVQ